MIPSYKKKSNIAAGVWIISMIVLIALVLFLSGQVQENIWEIGIATFVLIINCISFYYALWCFAKAKGYRGMLGVILVILSALGLLILLLLPDKMKDADQVVQSNGVGPR